MSAELILIFTLAGILLISPFLSNILKLPIAMVEITLGAVAKLLGLLHHNEMFSVLAEVGFLYLMLLAGMEVNLRTILKLDKSVFIKGFLFLFVLYALSIASVFVFKYSVIFIVILPLISIGLMLSIQQEIGKQPWLDLAIKIGVLGELLSILVLTVVSGYFEFGFGKELLFNIGMLFLFLVVLGIGFMALRTLFWWFPKLKIYIMPGSDKYFQDVRIAISMFFIMISIMLLLHLDVVLGAFIVGVFLSTFFEHNKDLEHKLAPFGFGFLITIFFVHVGSALDLSMVSLKLIADALILTFLMIFLRIVSSFLFFKELKLKNTILFGFSLSMPLTLLIAIATLAYQNDVLDDYWFTVVVAAAVLEVIVTMLGIKYIQKKL